MTKDLVLCYFISRSLLLSAFCFVQASLLQQQSMASPGEHPCPLLPWPLFFSNLSLLPCLQAALIGAILTKSSSFPAFLLSLGTYPFS